MKKEHWIVCAMCGAWLVAVVSVHCTLSTESNDNQSWEIYCAKYGIDKDNPTDEQETYYLDCYVGSTEEEEDMQ